MYLIIIQIIYFSCFLLLLFSIFFMSCTSDNLFFAISNYAVASSLLVVSLSFFWRNCFGFSKCCRKQCQLFDCQAAEEFIESVDIPPSVRPPPPRRIELLDPVRVAGSVCNSKGGRAGNDQPGELGELCEII